MKPTPEDKITPPNDLSVIEQELLKTNPKVFDGVKDKKEKEVLLRAIMSVTLQQRTHSGPLPDTQTLEDYNKIIPNGAERIMTVFEKQSYHRMELEKTVIRGQMFQSNMGQIFALVIGLSSIGCATYIILQGHEWAGSIIGVGGLTSLVTAFIKGKDYQQKNLSAKNPS